MSSRRPEGPVTPGDPVAVELRLALARARAAAGLTVDPGDIGGRAVDREAVALALSLGAPLAPVLDDVEEVTRSRQALAAEVRRASAEGRAVAIGLVVAPPLLGLGAAGLVTDDAFGVLTASPVGRLMVLVAAVLWGLGTAFVVLAVRRASVPPRHDDRVPVLVATAVRAGEPLTTALRRTARADVASVAGGARVSSAAPVSGAAWVSGGGRASGAAHASGAVPDHPRPGGPSRRSSRPIGPIGVGRGRRRGTETGDPAALALWLDLGAIGPPPPGWSSTGPLLADAVASGVPLAPGLQRLAAAGRAAAHAAALERAARLSATLAVPTALLLLPAGLLLAAGPLLVVALEGLG